MRYQEAVCQTVTVTHIAFSRLHQSQTERWKNKDEFNDHVEFDGVLNALIHSQTIAHLAIAPESRADAHGPLHVPTAI